MSTILAFVEQATYDRIVELLHVKGVHLIEIARMVRVPQRVVSAINSQEEIRIYEPSKGTKWTPGPGYKGKKIRARNGTKRK